MDTFIQTLAVSALPVIFAITLHEAAHGYAARHFGDLTAWQAGRISLNPFRHIDLVGTIVVPVTILLLSAGNFLFGWAKPVPVDFGRLRHPKQDMFWVAAAGPGANLLMALGWAAVLKFVEMAPENIYSLPLARMADIGVDINLVLMTLNLVPIPPLDGGRIVVSLLPQPSAWKFARLEPWGFPLLLLLLFTGVLGAILTPVIGMLRLLIATLFNFHY
ncbi:MAG TPA: site-2 protease family protein [Rhodocyclaceae bacterium]|nr:site-2 protease family protein [Rhodocyclaceae bacterium]